MNITLPIPPSANRYWRNVKGRMVISQQARTYKVAVGHICNQHGIAPTDAPVAVTLNVFRPAKRGDLDNFVKCALDSLRGFAYVDDAQVIELHAYRHDDKHNPRVEVCVE